jgi:DNA gyrase subunit A
MVNLNLVKPDDQLMVITDSGRVIRTLVEQIREVGRNAQGVRVIRLEGDEHVVDVAPVAEREHENNGERESEAPPR